MTTIIKFRKHKNNFACKILGPATYVTMTLYTTYACVYSKATTAFRDKKGAKLMVTKNLYMCMVIQDENVNGLCATLEQKCIFHFMDKH